MSGIPLLFVAFFALPVFISVAYTDWKSKLIDTRQLYALIGLLYGAFFANGANILWALTVSFSLLLVQLINNRSKLPPWGSGDFPLLQAFGLLIMLYSPTISIFIIFMLSLLIFLGVYRWFFRDNSFAPVVLFTFLLFCFTKLVWI